MDKQALYNQIQEFNTKIVNEKETKTKRFYYVQDDIAIDKTNFIKELVQNDTLFPKQFDEVLDLCYGSGNLTTHILFDSGINYQNITYNDLNTNDRNNELGIGTKSDHDFLDENGFTTKYDLIIFNPQIGGSELGAVTFESNIKPISFDNNLENYLITLGIDIDKLTISQNLTERSYLIHSDTLTKKEMEEMGIKDIKLFNYYDVFYQSKNNNKEGTNSTIVKLKKTINKISKSNTILAFFGEPKYAELLFADYTYIRQYSESSGKQFYVLGKHSSSKKCFTNNHGQFHEINCETDDKSINYDRIDNFDDLVLELDKYESKENKLNGNNEESFRIWWYESDYTNADGKKFEQATKNAYFNGIKKLSEEHSINIFSIQNIEEVKSFLERLTSGDLKEINSQRGYNPSNGLKQYIKFLEDNTLNPSCITTSKQPIKLENDLFKFSNEPKGKLAFKYQNILFKGVPGTGKSKTIDTIINDKLEMKNLSDNVLRINIHSASSNSDLMQGISISTTNDNENVLYKEKRGAILNHIFKSIYKPKQPFVLVLEEIQENSLNELIGDLIYLIEDKKRTTVDLDIQDDFFIGYSELFEKIYNKEKEKNEVLHYVELPSLVENSNHNVKMIIPDNLFIFCTSNYRDDKKVIEDNLLRRFDVIEIYPKTRDQLGTNNSNQYIFKSQDVSNFLEKLNRQILEQFKNETHPDRYMIGHANWLDIKEEDNEDSKIAFYKALLKVIIEFKEIREIDFDNEVKPILENVLTKEEKISDRLENYLNIFYKDDKLELRSYKNIVDLLQQEVYKSFL